MAVGSDCSCPAGNAGPAFPSTPTSAIYTYLLVCHCAIWIVSGPWQAQFMPSTYPSFGLSLRGQVGRNMLWDYRATLLWLRFYGSISPSCPAVQGPTDEDAGVEVQTRRGKLLVGSADHTETVSCLIPGSWVRLRSDCREGVSSGRQDSG